MATKTILLDVGGTFIKCSDGRKVPVDSDGGVENISSAFKESVGNTGGLKSIGVCIPGPFDYRRGIFLMKHKYAAVYGLSFRELAGIPASVSLHFVHDVNAPLMGLLAIHPALRKGTVALVTLGTGLGFSYAVDGEVKMNENLGPALSLYNHPFRDGILEDYVSRRALLRSYGKPLPGDVKELSDLAREGDEKARKAFLDAGKAFAEGAGPLLEELGIKTVFFGGQIAKSFDLMRPAAEPLLPGIELLVVDDYGNATLKGLQASFEK